MRNKEVFVYIKRMSVIRGLTVWTLPIAPALRGVGINGV